VSYHFAQVATGYYEAALVHFDKYNATNFAETNRHFISNVGCITQAIQFWQKSITTGTPQAAATATIQFIDQLFQAQTCA